MNETSISWTHGYQGRRGRTWNPTDGCDVCSPGCANCYAMRMAGRFSGPGKPYAGLITIGKNKRAVWNGKGRVAIDRLTLPLRWKAPSLVFVDSMSDLYYDAFDFKSIAAVYGIMALAKHHVFQVLTKRAKRRRQWYAWVVEAAHAAKQSVIGFCVAQALELLSAAGLTKEVDRVMAWYRAYGVQVAKLPLPNVWEGTSVENQRAADERVVELMDTPAAVHFLSCEPLLDEVNLRAVKRDGATMRVDALTGGWAVGSNSHRQNGRIDWVIAGVESGPGRRLCEDDRIRSLRDQCAATGTAFFLKQMFETKHHLYQRTPTAGPGAAFGPGAKWKARQLIEGPYLDGVQHKEFPRAA